MKLNIFKYLLFSICFSALFTSCVEDDGWQYLEDEGTNSILISEGPETAKYFSPFTNVVKVNAFTLMRDVVSNSELQKSPTVNLKLDQSIIDNYNEEHGDSYELLPNDFYILGNSKYVKASNGDYSISLPGGAFAETFSINIDGSKWTDLGKKYALAFRVQDVEGLTPKAGQDSILVRFAIKNKWDGIYEVTGSMTDVTNSTLTHINNVLGDDGPVQYTLETISETKCLVVDNMVAHGPYIPISSGTSTSYYGSFGLVLEFDPATDKIISVTNYWGQPAANTRSAQLDPSGVNQYDATTKTIDITYRMLQPSVVTAAPNIRTTWEEEWKYVRARE